MLSALQQLKESVRPEVWLVTELPITDVPAEFMDSLRRTRRLIVVEEHTLHGGFRSNACPLSGIGGGLSTPSRINMRWAMSPAYTSQKFHRAECGLDPASIVAAVSCNEPIYDDPLKPTATVASREHPSASRSDLGTGGKRLHWR